MYRPRRSGKVPGGRAICSDCMRESCFFLQKSGFLKMQAAKAACAKRNQFYLYLNLLGSLIYTQIHWARTEVFLKAPGVRKCA